MRAFLMACLALGVGLSLGCKKDPSTPAYWDEAIGSGRKAQDRVRVIERLRGSEHLKPALLPVLHGRLKTEKSGEVKAELAKALGVLADPSSVQPLGEAIELGTNDAGSNQLNREIAAALARMPSPEAVPPLLRMLRAKDPYVQVEAIRALGQQRAKDAVEPLMAVAQDDGLEPLLNRRAVQSLGEIGDPRAIPVLVKLLFKQHPSRGDSFYGESAFSLYQIGEPAKDAALQALRGEDRELSAWAQQHRIEEAALYAKAAQLVGDLKDRRAEPVLLQRLAYRAEDPDLAMLVRMTAADALGRMRVTAAVRPISQLASDERLPARERYAWALSRIGGRGALPALEAAAGVGLWEVRERAIWGLTLLGDERELPLLERLKAKERQRTAQECERYDLSGCSKPEQLAEKRIARIGAVTGRLEAARECKADVACWEKKLAAPEAALRERAALELGRLGGGAIALTQVLADPDPAARAAAVTALDWLTDADAGARAEVKRALPEIDRQLENERSKADYLRVNEELRRLAVKLQREI